MCVLLGYGADAICPYLIHDLIKRLHDDNSLPALNITTEQMIHNYHDACDHGILKVNLIVSSFGKSTFVIKKQDILFISHEKFQQKKLNLDKKLKKILNEKR